MSKLAVQMDEANLMTHLMQMCPAKWQRQYCCTENLTPVMTWVQLLVLENVKSNVELDDKPPGKENSKGAKAKRKMESIDSRILKKAKKGWTEKH